MSVFKCKFTYKKNVKNSKKSTKNLLVEHKFIDQYFNILDLNKFRQANTELSNEASEILNEKVRLFAEENGGKKALPYEDAFKKIDIVNSKKVELPGKDFDETLAARMQAKLQELYPEIKLNITNNPIWEKGNNIFNQEEFNNQVNFRLKSIDILSSDKAKQVFEKGVKNKWSLDKILSELQVPKEQKQLIEDVLQTMPYFEEIPFNEQIALALAETFGYTIEVNTAKDEVEDYDMVDVTGEGNFQPREFIPDTDYIEEYDTDGNIIGMREVLSEKGKKQLEERENKRKPTQIYSNLTVPGGTNYTENEIATPDITPSIKGHAQFATDKGIGWFRSDDKSIKNYAKGFFELDGNTWNKIMHSGGIDYYKNGNFTTASEYNNALSKFIPEQKARRILEVQSDLFQKGRDKENLVSGNLQSFEEKEFIYKDTEGSLNMLVRSRNENGNLKIEWKNSTGWEILTTDTFRSEIELQRFKDFIEKEINVKKENVSSNKFLQLLNKDNNWVTFFIKSIIQDSAKKGYEKVLFPSGNTASKVEGHTTLEEFKKQKEAQIKNLEDNPSNIKKGEYINKNNSYEFNNTNYNKLIVTEDGWFTISNSEKSINVDKNAAIRFIKESGEDVVLVPDEKAINVFKQELERVETEGFGALKPIYNFYENVVTSILKKQFGKENVKTITDEYGNTWNELTINQARDLANVMLQRNEANQIIGQANIKAMTVLIDAINQKQDTLPHEYAHHYIAWNRNTLIVQEAIKKWGGEEALVQSIGEQSVKQKGEAWSWWQKFVKWLLGDLSKLSKLDKERLTKILTDAFLTRQDLSTLGKPAEVKRIDSNVLQVNINSQEQFLEYLNNNKDKIIILESNSELSTINAPGIGELSNIPMDNVMTINTINSSKEELVESFENIDIELRADGTFDVVFINDNYGSQLKNSNPVLYTTLNTLLKNNFNFNNTNTDLIEAAENNDAQFEYQLTIDFSETADVLNNLTCK